MYQISIASNTDREKVIVFLERQGLLENAWFIWFVSDAFQYNSNGISVLTCQLDDELVGVAYILDYWKISPSPYTYLLDRTGKYCITIIS